MLFIVTGPTLRRLNIEGVIAPSRRRNRTTPSHRERLRINASSRTRRIPVKVDLLICACQRRLSGKPALTRTDEQIDFDWNAASPAAGVDAKAFSVRWSGTVAAPGRGDYTLDIQTPQCWPCDDEEHFRVYLDGALVASESIE